MAFIISVDPGSSAAGIAVWEKIEQHITLVNCMNLYPDRETKDLGVFYKIESLMRKLEAEVYDEYEFETLYCEIPVYFESARGQGVAASGDLVKLTLSVGAISEFCRNRQIEFCPVRVIDWRGQLPEKVMQKRVRALFGEEFMDKLDPKSHSYDAIGIGFTGLTGVAI